MHTPAPVLKDVEISYNTIRFNGSLFKENVYRQAAGPEVDAAWQSIGVDCEYNHSYISRRRMPSSNNVADRSAIVPSALAEQSGLSFDQVQVSEKYGGGFPANVEGLHHLHCLVCVTTRNDNLTS